MATTTVYVTCSYTEWTLLADGATIAEVGIQGDGAIAIAVATALPGIDSADWMSPPTIGAAPLVLPLSSGDKVYGKSRSSFAVGARLYRVTRT